MIPSVPDDLIAFAVIIGLTLLAVGVIQARLTSLERRLDRVARLDAKVDALLRHAGVAFDPYRDVPPEVREAIERGETILAIKRLREATGIGLKEAKELVDEIRRHRAPAR
jgi:ribosomal protein L7/L12